MFLILSSPHDYAARWAYEGLLGLGLKPLEYITSEELAYSRYWEHRVGADGASIRIGLPDGRAICGSRVGGVLNRLLSAPPDLVNCARPIDRDYASQELSSFYLSWLYALPGAVINRPAPQGFCGRWRHVSEWVGLAFRAGLPAKPYRQTVGDGPEHGYRSLASEGAPVHSAIVLGDQVFGPELPSEISAACQRLAELAGAGMLGVDLFRGDDGGWQFATASPYPDMTLGGTPLLKQLAHLFIKGRKQ